MGGLGSVQGRPQDEGCGTGRVFLGGGRVSIVPGVVGGRGGRRRRGGGEEHTAAVSAVSGLPVVRALGRGWQCELPRGLKLVLMTLFCWRCSALAKSLCSCREVTVRCRSSLAFRATLRGSGSSRVVASWCLGRPSFFLVRCCLRGVLCAVDGCTPLPPRPAPQSLPVSFP